MEYKILTSHSASGLNEQVKSHIELGFTPIGSHQVVETFRQERYSGNQHMSTVIEREYSQTMIKENV